MCFGLCSAYSLCLLVEELREIDPLGHQLEPLVLDPLDVEEVLEQRGRAALPAHRRSRGSALRIGGSKSRFSSSAVKPSTLASGVRSSCDTMLTSSVFIRSLSRNSVVLRRELRVALLDPLRHRR